MATRNGRRQTRAVARPQHARSTNTAPLVAFLTDQGMTRRSLSLAEFRPGSNYLHSTLFTVVNKIASAGSVVPYRFYHDTAGIDERQEADHPLLDRLHDPNRSLYASGEAMLHQLLLYVLLGGNGWLMPTGTTSSGVPAQLTALGRAHVVPERDDNRLLRNWRVTIGQRRVPLPPEALLHIRYPCDPETGEMVLGIGPLQPAQRDLDTDFAAQVCNAAIFKNGAAFDYAIVYKPQRPGDEPWLTTEQKDELERGLAEDHRGADKAHGFRVLQGPFDLVRLGMSQRELDYMEGRRFSREQIANVYNVPPILIAPEAGGLAEAAVKVGRRMLYENAVIPLLRMVQAALQVGLVDVYAPGLVGEFCFDEIEALREDQREKAELARTYWSMGVPLNQLIDRLGLPFDKVPWGDTVMVPFAQAPIESVIAGAELAGPMSAELPSPTEQPPQIEQPKAEEPEENETPRTVGVPTLITPRPTRLERWQAYARTWGPIEDTFQGRVRRHMLGLRAEVLERLRDELGRAATKGDRKGARKLMFNRARARKELQRSVKPLYLEAIELGIEGLAAELVAGAIGIESPWVAKLMETRSWRGAKRINDTVERRLYASLLEGISKGENLADLSTRVRQTMNISGAPWRTRMIARTEVGGTLTEARFEEMREQGVERHEWMSAGDDVVRTDPFNHRIDGEVVKVGERFSNGLHFPGDPEGEPGNIISCRCVAVPALD